MMGSGKSSVGGLLAEKLGWTFIDTDERIESSAGLSIRAIFEREGEAVFRRLERKVLEALPDREAVIALGGGAIVPAENRQLLRSRGKLVWLDAQPETLSARVGTGAARPLVQGLDEPERVSRLRGLRAERMEAYAQADVKISTDDRTAGEVCEAVLREICRETSS